MVSEFQVKDGKPVLVHQPKIDFINDKAGKAVGIYQHIGRRPILAFGNADADMQTLVDDAAARLDAPPVCATTSAVQAVLEVLPGYADDLRAMLVLSWVGESLVNPIFARTDAIGSVMRKKIEPVTLPIRQQLAQLLGS